MSDEGKMSRALNKSREERDERPKQSKSGAGGGHFGKAYDSGPRTHSSAEWERVPVDSSEPDGAVVMYHDKWGQAASQVRSICQKVLGKDQKENPQVITVTSGSREEGKTITTFNLAVALSEVQEGRVLILDSDLRGPGIYRLANAEPDKGLSELLREESDLDGGIYETPIPNVDMISSPNVTQLNGQQGLLARRCRELLNRLRQHYAFIVVDTPPVISSSESRIFGKESDGALMVARLETTPRDVVKRSVSELKNSGVKVLGCVLTDRKHHIPGFLYRLLGHSSANYYYKSYGNAEE